MPSIDDLRHSDPSMSQYNSYMHNNIPLQNPEIQRVQARFEEMAKEIRSLEAQAETLQACHAIAIQERCKLEKLLSPMRRLPPELVAEVFKACFHRATLDRADRHKFQILRSVSRTWRAVAFETPALWAGIDVVVDYHDIPKILANYVRAWFDRAGDSPLSLTATLRSFQRHFEVFLAIAAENRHWVHLDFNCSGPSSPHSFLQITKVDEDSRPWRRVRKLVLDGNLILHKTLCSNLEAHCPELIFLQVTSLRGLSSVPPTFSHSKLRTLVLRQNGPEIGLIKGFPNLHALAIQLGHLEGVHSASEELIVCEHVESLKLVHDGEFNYLRQLTLPALKTLTLVVHLVRVEGSAAMNRLVDIVSAFIRRSSCLLQVLKISTPVLAHKLQKLLGPDTIVELTSHCSLL